MAQDKTTNHIEWCDYPKESCSCPNDFHDRIQELEVMLSQAWQPIETAPKDGTKFLAYSQGYDLSPIVSMCAWHPQAGFCTDELREPTHWMPLPAPPVTYHQVGS